MYLNLFRKSSTYGNKSGFSLNLEATGTDPVDGKNENARGFPLSAYGSVFLQHAVACVNQLKIPVAREGLIIIQKLPGGRGVTVRGRCGVG